MSATQEKCDSTTYPSLSEFLCSNYSLKWPAKMFTPDLLSESKTHYCKSASKHREACLRYDWRFNGKRMYTALQSYLSGLMLCAVNIQKVSVPNY